MNDPRRELVERGYDRVAGQYLATKDPQDPLVLPALEEITRDLRPGSPILDLGCGAGIPVTLWLADRGFAVTGVDLSEKQLELARELVPAATFLKSDMVDLTFEPGAFSAVVAFYSITHVPRHEQSALLDRIHRWLGPGGLFLATWATDDWEGEERDWEGWGAQMWWSNHDRETNLGMLRNAGLVASSIKEHGDEDERWLWILARKEAG